MYSSLLHGVDTIVSTDSNDPHTAPQQRVLAVTTRHSHCTLHDRCSLGGCLSTYIFDASSIHYIICYPTEYQRKLIMIGEGLLTVSNCMT